MAPRKQWIDKKSATTYQLFHRPQNDPLIHDSEAGDRLLHQVSGPPLSQPRSAEGQEVSKFSKSLKELEKEFSGQARRNEGEAANYGIFYDDTKYDYMQHLRDLGGDGSGHFVEAEKPKAKPMKLEDALRMTSLDDDNHSQSVHSAAPTHNDGISTASSSLRKTTYQDQQDVPDEIAGFQPDMDPRLREVLEALDNDEFVDEKEDQDLFGQLVDGGANAEVDLEEFRDHYFDYEEDDDDGFGSDTTEKARDQPSQVDLDLPPPPTETHDEPRAIPAENEDVPEATPEQTEWMKEFAKYKKDIKSQPRSAAKADDASLSKFTGSTAFTAGGTPIRHKKRKGALTNPSSFSMTSSSLARTEGHRLLDDRFEKVEALYAVDEEGEEADDDGMSAVSGMTGLSKVSGLSEAAPSLTSGSVAGDAAVRQDFNSIMDGFLDNWTDRAPQAKRKGAKGKKGKNGNEAVGIQMLDELRDGLGPAKLPYKR